MVFKKKIWGLIKSPLLKKVNEMKCYYDFHIHTCLSPCGGEENTPNNVVNFAKMLGYDAIAICDHNTAGNVLACQKVGESVGLIVIAGMEVTTSEDIHVVCLFKTAKQALKLEEIVLSRMMIMPNDERIFGKQIYMNENDEVTGENPNFTLYGVDIGIYEIAKIVESLDGICFPAHVLKEGSGIIPILGGMDDGMGFKIIEKGKNATAEDLKNAGLENYHVLDNSDAHYLESMREAECWLECERNVESIFQLLKSGE